MYTGAVQRHIVLNGHLRSPKGRKDSGSSQNIQFQIAAKPLVIPCHHVWSWMDLPRQWFRLMPNYFVICCNCFVWLSSTGLLTQQSSMMTEHQQSMMTSANRQDQFGTALLHTTRTLSPTSNVPPSAATVARSESHFPVPTPPVRAFHPPW